MNGDGSKSEGALQMRRFLRNADSAAAASTADELSLIDGMRSLIEQLSAEIREYTALSDRYFAFAGTILVATLGVLAGNNGDEFRGAISIAAPFAFLGILHYVAQLQTEKAARLGMKRAAEERLLTLLPGAHLATVAILESCVGQRRTSVKLSIAVYIAAVATTVGLLVRGMSDSKLIHDSPLLSAAVVASLVLLAVAAGSSTMEMLRAEASAYNSSKSGRGPSF
ncbi:hypothetical protein ACFUMH_04325 [Cellulomonas sp. NPDC057328]|uniref:hypothetical protein n=1 Tax=Cellulomonas sp. NPDC057328 TaxID=3346101 RepID=UPI003625745A